MEFKDYYELLGVPQGADGDVIKSAYRRLARKYHPDVSKEKDAEEKFKAINEAHEVLKDPQKRKAYDQLRARGYRPGEEFQPPPNWNNQEFEFDLGDLGGGGFSDFFESLFGRARPGPNPSAHGARRSRNTSARLAISLERAFSGGSERIQVDGKTLDVKIPAGIQPGQHIRLARQGHAGGDLLLEIHYQPHPRFKVEGQNLKIELPIAPWEAALGAQVTIPTLDGPVELKVPAGSNSGRQLRLKGKGLPGPAASGDLFVVLDIHSPKAETEAQKELFAKLAAAFPDFQPRKG